MHACMGICRMGVHFIDAIYKYLYHQNGQSDQTIMAAMETDNKHFTPCFMLNLSSPRSHPLLKRNKHSSILIKMVVEQ